MITRGSVRRKSKEIFKKVITLRKQGHSYSEIKKETGVAKSTINNWIAFAGLNLSQEHLQIQTNKRLENYKIGMIASRITRLRKKQADIQNTLEIHKRFFNDPFYNYGIALYEGEGTKDIRCSFSNSDFRLVNTFVHFLEKYFLLKRQENMVFRLYIHELRKSDLERIMSFWSNKILIPKNTIKVSWKRNVVTRKRQNLDYVGQMSVTTKGERILGSKIQAISDIILRKYQRL